MLHNRLFDVLPLDKYIICSQTECNDILYIYIHKYVKLTRCVPIITLSPKTKHRRCNKMCPNVFFSNHRYKKYNALLIIMSYFTDNYTRVLLLLQCGRPDSKRFQLNFFHPSTLQLTYTRTHTHTLCVRNVKPDWFPVPSANNDRNVIKKKK